MAFSSTAECRVCGNEFGVDELEQITLRNDSPENHLRAGDTILVCEDDTRVCDVCGMEINSGGYMLGDGDGYWCSEDCARKDPEFGPDAVEEKMAEWDEEGDSDFFWTDWL